MTEFEEHIFSQLADIKVGIADSKAQLNGINRRLDTLNGSVAYHTVQINSIQHKMIAEDAAGKVRRRIRSTVLGGIWALAGAGVGALVKYFLG